jgi:hypothetical protein
MSSRTLLSKQSERIQIEQKNRFFFQYFAVIAMTIAVFLYPEKLFLYSQVPSNNTLLKNNTKN